MKVREGEGRKEREKEKGKERRERNRFLLWRTVWAEDAESVALSRPEVTVTPASPWKAERRAGGGGG